MASEVTIKLWTDVAPDRSLASDLATEAAKAIFRTTGQQASVVAFDATEVEPHDVHDAAQAFAEAADYDSWEYDFNEDDFNEDDLVDRGSFAEFADDDLFE